MTFRLRFRNSQVEERKEDRSYANTNVTIPSTIISTSPMKTSMPSVASISSINRLSEILEQSRDESREMKKIALSEALAPPTQPLGQVKSVLVYKTHSIDTIPSSVLVFPFDGETYRISEILLYGTFPSECEIHIKEASDIEHPHGFSTFTVPKGTSVCRWKVESSPTSLTALEIVGELKAIKPSFRAPIIKDVTHGDVEDDSDDENVPDILPNTIPDPCKIHTIEINMVSI